MPHILKVKRIRRCADGSTVQRQLQIGQDKVILEVPVQDEAQAIQLAESEGESMDVGQQDDNDMDNDT